MLVGWRATRCVARSCWRVRLCFVKNRFLPHASLLLAGGAADSEPFTLFLSVLCDGVWSGRLKQHVGEVSIFELTRDAPFFECLRVFHVILSGGTGGVRRLTRGE